MRFKPSHSYVAMNKNKEGRFVMSHEQKWTKMYKQFTDADICDY